MLNWILSSSVLILGIIGIRFLFQKKMKCKIQYALWLLVLIRLLVPFSIGHSSMSVSNTVSTISPIVMDQSQVTEQPWDEVPMEPPVLPAGGADRNPGMEKQPASPMVEAESISFREMLPKILSGIWITGSIVTGLTFLSANVTFRRRLKVSRHRIPDYPCKLPVYVTNRIQSPCLFGMHHPAIYLTRQVMENETMVRHTVAHEFTHYRHKDHMWVILRGVCLTIHWFNPLVWWAAILSQRDAELACDEDTIQVLGEGERKAYGMTLIHVSCQKNTHLLTAATTMTADKKVLKQRIQTIARKPKNAVIAVIAVTLLAAVFVGCTFSGAEKAKNEDDPLPGETTLPTAEASQEPVLLSEIISGTGSFYSVDFGKDMTLGDFCSTFAEGSTLKLQRYALVDLDRDGTEEVVFELSIEEDNPMGSLILHQSGEGYMGYSRYYRQMNSIKEDGTFHWSNGAANNGFARVTGFGPDDILEENITWADDTEGPTDFYVNREKAEESQYWTAVEEEEAKQEPNWVRFTEAPTDSLPRIKMPLEESEARLFEFILLPISTSELENTWEAVCRTADICHFRSYEESGFGFVEDPSYSSNYLRIDLGDGSHFNTMVGVRQMNSTNLQVRITDIDTNPRYFTDYSNYTPGNQVDEIDDVIQYLSVSPTEDTLSKLDAGRDLLEKVFLPIVNGEIENTKPALLDLVEKNGYYYSEAEGLFSVAADPYDYEAYIFGTPYLENRNDILGSLGIHFKVNGMVKEAEIRYYKKPIECVVLLDEETMDYKSISIDEIAAYFNDSSDTEEASPIFSTEPVTFDGYTFTPEGDSVPVKLTMAVENVQEGEAAWKQLLSQEAQLPEPEQGKEYIIVTVKVTYEAGELETLNFVENYPASLAAARVHFNVPNENSNTEDVTYNLANPIWGPDPFEGRFLTRGDSITGDVAFLQEIGNKQPLYFEGYNQVISFQIH